MSDSVQKPKIFMIMPFSDDHLALYEKFKDEFAKQYEITHAGDLDTQGSIINDIITGIRDADVIIADLTGQNPNVFYELGIAHAMRKKTIMIVQDIDELPFDLRSYRVIPYSMIFHKIPLLINGIMKMLNSAIDGSMEFGNPVTDYINDNRINIDQINVPRKMNLNDIPDGDEKIGTDEDDEKGIFEYMSDIEEHSEKMNAEVSKLGSDLELMSMEVNKTTAEINKANVNNGAGNATYIRNKCRKLAAPIEMYAERVDEHIKIIRESWESIEESYLHTLESPMIKSDDIKGGIQEATEKLKNFKGIIRTTDSSVYELKNGIKYIEGLERHLSRAAKKLNDAMDNYLSLTSGMESSLERIIKRSEMFNETEINSYIPTE